MSQLSVAVSSGGMKGMFTLGALHGLSQRRADVAEIASASSGAMSAAYYLSGQTEVARQAYLHLLETNFVDFDSLVPQMNIEYLWDIVFSDNSPYQLDVQAVLDSDIDFYMPLVNARTVEQEVFTNRQGKDVLIKALMASVAVPVWFGGLVDIDGEHYFDGGVINPIPASLLQRQDTELLIVSTRKNPFVYRPSKNMFSLYAQYQYGSPRQSAADSVIAKLANISLAEQLATDRSSRFVLPELNFYQLSNNRQLLERAFEQGQSAV